MAFIDDLKKKVQDYLKNTQQGSNQQSNQPIETLFGDISIPQFVQPHQPIPMEQPKNVLPSILKTAKEILLEPPARAAASLELQALGQKQFTPQIGVEKFFLGEEPIYSIGERIEMARPIGEYLGQKVAGKIGGEIGKGLAPVAVLGMTALDLAPFGGTKKTLEEALLKTKTAEEAASLLTKAKVPQDLIEFYAPKFAQATKIEDVKNGLKSLENVLKTTKPEVLGGIREFKPEIMSIEEYLNKKGVPEFDYSMQTTKGGRTVREQKRVEKQLQDILHQQIEAIKEYRDKVKRGEIIPLQKGEPVMPENIIARIRSELQLKLLQQGEKPENVEKIVNQKTAGIEQEIKNLEKQGVNPLGIEKILREKILGEKGIKGIKPEVKPKVKPETKITPEFLRQKARGTLKTETQPVTQPEIPPPTPPVKPPQMPGSPSLEALPPNDPVKKLVSFYDEMEKARAKTESLYSAERAKRAAKIAEAGQKLSGEEAYIAQLAAAKGELPKANIAQLRQYFSQQDIDELFNRIENSELMPYQKISAKHELAKAFRGVTPTESGLKLLQQVFPKEFVETLKIPQHTSLIGEIVNIPRTLMASTDLSAGLRQGIFMIGRPKEFLSAFISQFKYAASEKAYQGLMEDIVRHPLYPLAEKLKLALTDIDAGILTREERYVGSNLAEKIPGVGRVVRASDRAYTGFLNKLRWDIFKDTYNQFKGLGYSDKELEETIMPQMVRVINAGTGRGALPGELAKAGPVLSGVAFAPRLVSSRLTLLNPAFYIKLPSSVRKWALGTLLRSTAIVGTLMTLFTANGWKVGTNPLSADFGKVKKGNTRIDLTGGRAHV